MSQTSFNQKNGVLKLCSLSCQTDRRGHTKVNKEDPLSGFQKYFLQPLIKDRSNKYAQNADSDSHSILMMSKAN